MTERPTPLAVELVAAVEEVLRRRLRADAAPHPAITGLAGPARSPLDRSSNAKLARSIYRARRDRDAEFAPFGNLFGEPGWDILLDLYRARAEQQSVSINSACIASAVPDTTGLRHLALLERNGLVQRTYDPFDRRRCFVSLTDISLSIMDAWLARLAAEESASGVLR